MVGGGQLPPCPYGSYGLADLTIRDEFVIVQVYLLQYKWNKVAKHKEYEYSKSFEEERKNPDLLNASALLLKLVACRKAVAPQSMNVE